MCFLTKTCTLLKGPTRLGGPRPCPEACTRTEAFPTLLCKQGGLRPSHRGRGRRYGRPWDLLSRGECVLVGLISVSCTCCGMGVCVCLFDLVFPPVCLPASCLRV